MMDPRWPTHLNGVPVPYSSPVSELWSLATSTATERWAAILALARSSDGRVLGWLAELTTSEDPYVRRLAVEVIGKRPDGRQLGDLVVQRMRDPHPAVVRTAAETAAHLHLASAHADLLLLLDASESPTRATAVRALAELWQEDDLQLVVTLFESDASPEVRKEAAWTLRQTVSASHAELLVRLWASDLLARHRVWACEIARMFPELHIDHIVAHLTKDVDGHVRKAARRTIDEEAGAV